MAQRWIATDFGGLDVFTEVDGDVPAPGRGEVTIAVRAAGMNPADFKHVATGSDRSRLPVAVGYEVAGVLTALGADTEIASGGGTVGDEVLAFPISGGYASSVTVAAKDVFAKPSALDFPSAANLLLAASTAAEEVRSAVRQAILRGRWRGVVPARSASRGTANSSKLSAAETG